MNAYEKALEKVQKAQEKYKNQLCCTSQIGIIGPTGPTGPAGVATNIVGSFASLEDLEETYPNGTNGDAYIIGDYLYNWSHKETKWLNVGLIRGPEGTIGPTGQIGATGPRGGQGIQGLMGPTGATCRLDKSSIIYCN